jgi:hypothetical protein
MEITKDIIVICKDGDFTIKMGAGMTSIYFKNQEKLVLYAKEIDKIIEMLQISKEKLNN